MPSSSTVLVPLTWSYSSPPTPIQAGGYRRITIMSTCATKAYIYWWSNGAICGFESGPYTFCRGFAGQAETERVAVSEACAWTREASDEDDEEKGYLCFLSRRENESRRSGWSALQQHNLCKSCVTSNNTESKVLIAHNQTNVTNQYAITRLSLSTNNHHTSMQSFLSPLASMPTHIICSVSGRSGVSGISSISGGGRITAGITKINGLRGKWYGSVGNDNNSRWPSTFSRCWISQC